MMSNKPKPSAEGPDCGWSWVIAASCCFINMMMYGMMRLAGILFVETFQKFPVSREKASLPYSLASTMRNLSGPLVGLLGHKFGVRSVTGAGALVGTFGIAMCFLAKDVVWITVFWGGVFGLGFGLGNVLLPVSINQYFIKHRATASGISLSGACLGSFFLPPLVSALLSQYGLDGTFLIISGFVLNCLPFAMLLRKPTFSIPTNSVECESKHDKPQTIESNCNYTPEKPKTKPETEKYCDNCYFNPSFVLNETHIIGVDRQGVEDKSREQELIPDLILNNMKSDGNPAVLKVEQNSFGTKVKILAKDSVAEASVFHGYDENSENVGPPSTLKKSLMLLTNPMFILISVSVALYGFTFVCMITAIVDFAADIGVEQSQSTYVIMCFSVGDLLGRLGLGWVTDRGYMTKAGFSAMCFLFQGIAGTAVICAFDFWSLLSITFIYGLFEAGLIVIFPLLIAQYVNQDLQTIAIPTSNVLYGPACLAVPLTIGFFREEMGSYDGVFITVGAISVVCGIAWIIVVLWERWKKT